MWINYYACWAAHESLLGCMWPMDRRLSKADLPAQKEKVSKIYKDSIIGHNYLLIEELIHSS